MNIALYGGSFDPPHIGHVRVVEAALIKLPIDKLIIIPAYKNPFKLKVCASASKRLQWLKKLFKNMPKVEISDFEIRQNRSVYTIETVEHFRDAIETLYLIIGADNLEKLPQWHRFEELSSLVVWVVATRGESPIPDEMIRLDVDAPISSTDCRMLQRAPGLNLMFDHEIITTYKEINESKN
ncbi:MAG: nicotinate (nicotinamide) nucleotide adenylyltransferase [Sulfuricurvum sp.]|jgi:nicotinate-nucleotide adenylyltransferase|uniref:nicotinate (nicotinamide) nucleotide adenylyltransferase n=1 Tax=Sulfuricurvum sp. TaxID=2025608 RepID=UPI0025E7D7AD|nr:nicotinate (nicotinamide) nucleotide adenylyltransferase [Sulfuricurvum sp.]MCK9371732.1 nicotinate (nicotinamide) nucleotide adenylyltransferase [Sulfuricurvum sp.]